MSRGQPCAELPGHVERFLGGQSADAAQERLECLPVHELHRDVPPAVGLADVVHAAHVGVGDRPSQPHLGDQPLHEVSAPRTACNQLERNRLSELEVFSAIDLTHRSASEQADDAVAGGEDLAGRKPRIVQWPMLRQPGAARERTAAGHRCRERGWSGRCVSAVARHAGFLLAKPLDLPLAFRGHSGPPYRLLRRERRRQRRTRISCDVAILRTRSTVEL